MMMIVADLIAGLIEAWFFERRKRATKEPASGA
jgi:hypothetical protein